MALRSGTNIGWVLSFFPTFFFFFFFSHTGKSVWPSPPSEKDPRKMSFAELFRHVRRDSGRTSDDWQREYRDRKRARNRDEEEAAARSQEVLTGDVDGMRRRTGAGEGAGTAGDGGHARPPPPPPPPSVANGQPPPPPRQQQQQQQQQQQHPARPGASGSNNFSRPPPGHRSPAPGAGTRGGGQVTYECFSPLPPIKRKLNLMWVFFLPI